MKWHSSGAIKAELTGIGNSSFINNWDWYCHDWRPEGGGRCVCVWVVTYLLCSGIRHGHTPCVRHYCSW